LAADNHDRTAGIPYPHLLAPLQIGRQVLRNRVIMGSMHTRLEEVSRASSVASRFTPNGPGAASR